MTNVLTDKYRPKDFKSVIGQGPKVKSFRAALESRSNHSYLLAGPPGTGKTSLARIGAGVIGCEKIREVNGADFTGIDDMRQIIQTLNYKPLGVATGEAIIIDECHRLSGAAWSALLKPVEEPPPWVFWFFCTTEESKVPAAIKSRCLKYNLNPVSYDELFDWLDEIATKEKISMGADVDEHEAILSLCAKQAQGSPRTALTYLAACVSAKTKKDALSLLKSAEGSSGAIDLARALSGNTNWMQVQEILNTLKEENPEGVRHVVRAYVTKALMGNAKNPHKLFAVLEQFSQPFNSADGISPLVLACGRLLLAE